MPPHTGSRRLLAVLGGLYLAQGIPVGLSLIALPAILYGQGVGLDQIGTLGLLILPWAAKFVWAPQIDNRRPPLARGASRRVGWVITCQLATVAVTLVLLAVDPVTDFWLLLGVLLAANLLFATQDVAADALAVTRLHGRQWLGANAVQGGGFSLGMVAGGSGALFAFSAAGWTAAILLIVALLLACLLPVWLSRDLLAPTPEEAGPSRASIRRFLRRPGAWRLLLLSAGYKLPLMMGYGLVTTLLVDQGASYTEVSVTAATVVALVSVAGAAIAPAVVTRLGLGRSVSALLALAAVVWAALGGWLVAGGRGTAVPILAQAGGYLFITAAAVTMYAMFMALSSREQAGTDFTLFYCAEALGNAVATNLAGAVAASLGFGPTFLIAGVAGLGTVVVLTRSLRRLTSATDQLGGLAKAEPS
ncbi:MFS transporter [Nonomuraea sp. NPDC050663]|uniref:MFS transporter n=1 Tax=Nonomuraea sp. NPDC050663 TaxID=3364370 RepID=UPI00378D18E2